MNGARFTHPVVPVGKVPGLDDVYFVAMMSKNSLLAPEFRANAAEYFPAGKDLETSKSIFQETGRDLGDRSLATGMYNLKASQINNGLLPQAVRGSKLVRHDARFEGYDLEMLDVKMTEIRDQMSESLSSHGRHN